MVKKKNWLTKGLQRCSVNKRFLYLKYRYSQTNKILHRKKYLQYTKIFRKCLNHSQRITNTKIIKSSRNVCKTTWDIIKKNSQNKANTSEITHITLESKTRIDDSTEIATQFNNYFINLTNNTNFDDNIKSDTICNIEFNPNTIYLTPISEYTILSTIKGLKKTNATGFDGINTKILKKCANCIAIPIAHIVNLSLSEGHFPSILKRSVIKPLHKKGAYDALNNYRPITLIPVMSKIFERIMYDKIYHFLSTYKLLISEQYGFRKGNSTTHACFDLIRQVLDNMNEGMKTMALYLDMSSAFDFVSHRLLLMKLDRYGIRGNALEWIESYLRDRQQRVEVSRIVGKNKLVYHSEYQYNKYGVPQGSVLGPLLFLIYINDLPMVTKQHCVLFADDTTLIIKSKNKDNLEIEANSNLSKIVDWLEYNNLKINTSKTKYMNFLTKNSRHLNIDINYKEDKIEEANTISFLGIVIDNYCNWKAQIDNVVTKIDRFIYVIYRIRQTVSKEAALSSYHGYVASVLRYGIVLWGNSVDMNRAFKVQKKCIRTICGVGYLDSCKSLFKSLGILPLPCLYIFETCLFVKKNLHLYKKNNDYCQYRGRYGNKLCVPKCKLDIYAKNCYNMSIKIFNKLPQSLINLTYYKFKKELFNILIVKIYYNINDYLNDVL